MCLYLYIHNIYTQYTHTHTHTHTWKWNQHLHKACQQKDAWSALKFPGRWLRWLWTQKTVDQHQQMTWQPKSSLTVETSHWTSSNMDSVPLHSPPDSGTLISKWKCKNLLSSEKRTLDHWATVQFFFSTAQVRCFWRLSLVPKWLCSPFPKDVWAWWLLMHWLQLQSTPCEALPSVWISLLDCILKLAVIPVACAPFPTQILPSSQLCI